MQDPVEGATLLARYEGYQPAIARLLAAPEQTARSKAALLLLHRLALAAGAPQQLHQAWAVLARAAPLLGDSAAQQMQADLACRLAHLSLGRHPITAAPQQQQEQQAAGAAAAAAGMAVVMQPLTALLQGAAPVVLLSHAAQAYRASGNVIGLLRCLALWSAAGAPGQDITASESPAAAEVVATAAAALAVDDAERAALAKQVATLLELLEKKTPWQCRGATFEAIKQLEGCLGISNGLSLPARPANAVICTAADGRVEAAVAHFNASAAQHGNKEAVRLSELKAGQQSQQQDLKPRLQLTVPAACHVVAWWLFGLARQAVLEGTGAGPAPEASQAAAGAADSSSISASRRNARRTAKRVAEQISAQLGSLQLGSLLQDILKAGRRLFPRLQVTAADAEDELLVQETELWGGILAEVFPTGELLCVVGLPAAWPWPCTRFAAHTQTCSGRAALTPLPVLAPLPCPAAAPLEGLVREVVACFPALLARQMLPISVMSLWLSRRHKAGPLVERLTDPGHYFEAWRCSCFLLKQPEKADVMALHDAAAARTEVTVRGVGWGRWGAEACMRAACLC